MTDLDQLEGQKRLLLAIVEGWSAERLSYRPAPECWSAAKVFDHLVKTEERILAASKDGLLTPHRIGISDRARTVFLRKVFESNRRVKVPDSASVVLPDEAPEMDVIQQRWQAVRGDLASLMGRVSPRQMRQGIFRHPVGGWMALPDVVDFFSVHMMHHTYQLERLSAESKSL